MEEFGIIKKLLMGSCVKYKISLMSPHKFKILTVKIVCFYNEIISGGINNTDDDSDITSSASL